MISKIFRNPEDYFIAIKPDNTMVRCYDKNVPEEWALITPDSPNRNTFYNVYSKLKPQFWALPRYRK